MVLSCEYFGLFQHGNSSASSETTVLHSLFMIFLVQNYYDFSKKKREFP